MFSSITHNCIPAIVCSQHTQLVSSNRLCCYRSSHVSDYRHVCLVSHTSCSFELFLFSWINTNSSSGWTACRMSYTPLIWLTVTFVLPNHKQFIRVNHLLYITHTFIWLPVSFVPPHCKQLIELNHMPCIAHATKIWTVFDASSIANVLHLFWRGFYATICNYCITHSLVEGSLIVVSH